MIHMEQAANTTKEGTAPAAKILVVEDDSYLRASIKDILEIEAYTVITAHDGREGLEKLNADPNAPPDLIVSDIMMPYMDGFEFLDVVRSERRWVSIPFIFLTAKSEKVDIFRGKDLGADDYLHKPFDAEDLLNAVKARLKRRDALAQAEAEAREGVLTDQKKSMLAMIGHEFRTPLTLVVAYNEMLKDFESGQLNESDMFTFLKGVNDGASRLRRLVENFMLLVELDSGDAVKNYAWRKRKIDNPEAILTMAQQQIFNPLVEHRCSIVVEGSLPPLVAELELLVIAVRELLLNVVKHSQATEVHIELSRVDDSYLIAVQDNGCGFSPVSLLFDSENSRGFGLFNIKSQAEYYKGSLEIDNAPEKGTRVAIRIPLDENNREESV